MYVRVTKEPFGTFFALKMPNKNRTEKRKYHVK